MKVKIRIKGDASLTIRMFRKDFPIYNGHLDQTENVDLSLHGYTTTFPLIAGFSGGITVDADKGLVLFSVLAAGITLFSYPVTVGDLTGNKPLVVKIPSVSAQSGFWKGLKLTNAEIDFSLA